ncbi:hypothetical protein N7481_001371 [Penicillium waksmanii]|uniref:uncharacterized protein n=1 Tax=Penicillium waksmanii TaxID=69791 RepID=UPI002548D5AC|nr:uncharacterized protein N7481_001371 [Penicillium waksmanii]KAJ6000962.1 hypothetical protein N7481_001371 [Penicillium waksmanii]
MSTARHLQVGPYVSGMHLDLEGFQALAAVADDGRIDFDFHHSPGKAGEAVEQLISHMTQHEENKEQEDFAVGESPPILNIVIQVIGSPGDVQPFLVLGIELHNFGHRVRIATHPSFKTLVENVGLEFFSIGGDPQEMMVYMVKHPGLLPHFQKPDEGSAKEKRQAIREMLENLWKSCFITGNNFNTTKNISKTQQKPFVANAIIANPPSFAHIHCAEKLGVPLHMMFTMPWSPTRAFPHPLANIKTCSLNHSAANYFSFMLTDTLMWLGLRDLINSFRTETLDLEPIHILSAAAAVHKLKIPFTYCWPPSLIPKPVDWGPLISISGSYLLKPPVHYTPPQRLIEFLERFSSSIYIGFGSVVLENSDEVTRIVLNAIQKAGASAIINRGWANLGNNISKDLPNVLFIDDCPHANFLCGASWGGAGTTAAVIAAGKPSVLIPCYGDQFFWAEIATMAGAGPPPILFRNLSADRLADAIRVALTPQVSGRAFELGMRVAKENEISNGVEAFHRQISGYKMHCSIFPRRAASWRIKETSISLSPFAAAVLMEENVIELESIEL